MNGAKKFHSGDGPAFNPGEVWVATGGSRAVISHTERYGVDKWDVDVFYYYPTDATQRIVSKNAWGFQVRYEHQADKEI
jgi:hypothetical protein